MNELVLFDKKGKKRKIFYWAMVGTLIMVAGVNLYNETRQTVIMAEMIEEGGFSDLRAMQEAGEDMSEASPKRMADLGCWQLLDEYYPEIREQTIDIYALSLAKNLYFLYDLTPNNRFFILQNWHGRFSEQVRDEIVEDFQNNQPEYLLSDAVYVPKQELFYIHEVVEGNYHTVAEKYGCTLYQKND